MADKLNPYVMAVQQLDDVVALMNAPVLNEIEAKKKELLQEGLEVKKKKELEKELEGLSEKIPVPPHIHARLRVPKRVLTVYLPVDMDDLSTKVFTGFRSYHNDALGPTKGGIRFHPDVTVEEVMGLSMWMSWKCALLKLPYGGAKGGIVCDPKKMSRRELQQLTKEYVHGILPLLGPKKDIPAPDVGTGPREMAWICGEYSHHVSDDVPIPAVVTGKPLGWHGSEGREYSTALGCVYIIENEVERLGLRKDKPTLNVIIQGYGNAGWYIAKFLRERDYTIVGVSDSTGAIYRKDGLNAIKVKAHKDKTGSVVGYEGADRIESPMSLLEKECDILVPAALEEQITEENAPKIKAKIVPEAANGPTTPAADKILNEMGVSVLPDILANGGGVTGSYFEWVQGQTMYYWDENTVKSELKKKMDTAYKEVVEVMKMGVSMRTAAYILAVGRVAEAMKGIGGHWQIAKG